ncbi:BatA and WFA domain-containing protein [uncultured Maribacter sp.]|uniref:vWA domain-containing protein n=1 Tax=uncultured Maribacter sp. TaxID=431308 RepID=UPI002632BEE4|nr:BatA and WFA domain-containing protein [uncultured Maribacter sp.]
MQFKYPEILWGLFLLIIPIIIHLFQLRKFKKTPFTNVKLLKEVVSKSRKSSQFKKWLLLVTRLGIIAALVLAFVQPFFANKTALMEKETVIYLDNSFSMQAIKENGSLLSNAVQELIKETPKDQKISLFTNDKVYRNVDIKEIQNDLLSIENSNTQLPLNAILLKAKTLFSKNTASIKNTIVISDFQRNMISSELDSLENTDTHFVIKRPDNNLNVSIDSLYIDTVINENINIVAKLTSTSELESTPVSLYNGKKLIAKTSASFNTNKKAEVTFTIPKNNTLKGLVTLTDKGLKYDNNFYFNLDKRPKIKILAIGENNSFLKRIYTKEDFAFSEYQLKNLNYSLLQKQNTIVLNELTNIPNALTTALHSFTKEGGTLVVIPSKQINLDSYNTLTSVYFSTKLNKEIPKEQAISNIHFSHPIYAQVFEKKVTNFQYPKAQSTYELQTKASVALSYTNRTPFLVGQGSFYLFCAPLSKENSNFKNSPLIVPTFYNMGEQSLKSPQLYATLGEELKVDIAMETNKDHILSVEKEEYQFIPRQESHANKTSLHFVENPIYDGVYKITNKKNPIQNISFNYSRNESDLNYISLENLNSKTIKNSLETLFSKMQKDNSINALWKWFVTFALLFMILEMLFQKFLK